MKGIQGRVPPGAVCEGSSRSAIPRPEGKSPATCSSAPATCGSCGFARSAALTRPDLFDRKFPFVLRPPDEPEKEGERDERENAAANIGEWPEGGESNT